MNFPSQPAIPTTSADRIETESRRSFVARLRPSMFARIRPSRRGSTKTVPDPCAVALSMAPRSSLSSTRAPGDVATQTLDGCCGSATGSTLTALGAGVSPSQPAAVPAPGNAAIQSRWCAAGIESSDTWILRGVVLVLQRARASSTAAPSARNVGRALKA